MSAVDPLSIACEEHGIIPEEEFQRCLDRPDPIDNCPVKDHGMPLNQMTTNRQRAMVLSNPEYFEFFTMLRKHKEELVHAKELAAVSSSSGGSSSGVGGGVGAVKSSITTTASTVTNNDTNNNVMEGAVVAAQDVEEPPKKVRKMAKQYCSNPLCHQEISDFSNNDNTVCGQKKKWQRGGCKVQFCSRVECHAMLLQHRKVCLSMVK